MADALNTKLNNYVESSVTRIPAGQFLNPDNQAYRKERNSKIYVDKSSLIEYTNSVMGSSQMFICNSRPRRFGKSYAADMLAAYYSKGCDSEELFAGLDISRGKSFKDNLNKYNVIHLDIQWFWDASPDHVHIIDFITQQVINEIRKTFQNVSIDKDSTLSFALSKVNTETGATFIIIIDEWDFLIRDENASKKLQTEYIDFLRSLFKGAMPSRYIQLAYLTGILPIVRTKTESALNNFDEFTMINPDGLSDCFGFTEKDVRQLCEQYDRDYEKVRSWYDGYLLNDQQIYNPRAVVRVMLTGEFRSYWSETGSYRAIVPLINMNFDGLKEAIITLLSGSPLQVNVRTFENNPSIIKSRDEVITYLIHLGYLGYNSDNQTAFVPNEEVRQELAYAVEDRKWDGFQGVQLESEKLFEAVLNMDADAVAKGIGKVHEDFTSVIKYNDENSLSSVVTIAFLYTMKYYYKPRYEMPAGKGFADVIYVPNDEYRSIYPAMVIELKWNKNVRIALNQILERNYPDVLKDYSDNILLVGINYDKNSKKHTCIIQRYDANDGQI